MGKHIPYSEWTDEEKEKRNAKRRENRKYMTPEMREKERMQIMLYRTNNREKVNNTTRRYYKTTLSGRLSKYKSKAKERDAEWRLSQEEFEHLVRSNCWYCGHNPNPLNCVDRVDKRLGYERDNCKPSCNICSHMRKRLWDRDIVAQAIKITTHQELPDK